LGVLVAGSPAVRAGELAGVWVVDLEASDAMDGFLEAQGVGYLKRKAAAKTVVTLTIAQTGEEVRITTITPFDWKTSVLVVDGVTRAVERAGPQGLAHHAWDGEVLVSTVTMDDGSVLTVSRSISTDGATLTQRMGYRAPDGPTHVADRVFRRQGP